MPDTRLVSIIVTSHNYGRFLGEAIDGALRQTYPHTEVIVVDDGSTDNSREVIARYGNRLTPVLKENGGQGSAFNAGFRVARGRAICFVDSDDTLLPTAMERAIERFRPGVAKVHWPLYIVDQSGVPTGATMHRNDLEEGDLLEAVVCRGPGGYNWPSTSGNLWCSKFIASVFPIPEYEYRIGPDVYLSTLAPFFGTIAKISEAQGCYRLHGENNTYRGRFDRRVQTAVAIWDHSFSVLDAYCRKNGFNSDPEAWKANSWWHQTELAAQELANVVPAGESFILVDDNHWMTGGSIGDRRCVPFLERQGEYWGPPADGLVAKQELERMRAAGLNFIVFTSSTVPWLDYYPEFGHHLDSHYRRLFENSRLLVFDLGWKS